MPKLPCPYGARCKDGPQGAIWETIDIDFAEAKLLLDDHQKSHQFTVSPANNTALKAEKIQRPQIKIKDSQIEEDAWEYFLHQWSTYKSSTNLVDNAKQHLENCLGDEITLILFGRLGQSGWDSLSEEELLDKVKEVFIKKRNRMINRLKLRGLQQGPEQPVQQYVGMLKQVARTCKFNMPCHNRVCNEICDFSEEMVLDQLVQGLNDEEIQKKVLAFKEEDFTLSKVEKLIITEECGKATQKESKSGEILAPLSTFRKQKNKERGCSNCGSKTHISYRDLRKEDRHICPAHGKTCHKCGKANHLEAVCRTKVVETDMKPEENTIGYRYLQLGQVEMPM